MGKVNLMPDSLANKIAAGEVVERPASVVKELVENCIDAGSTSIKVELEEAGLSKIRIIDDGEGMTEEDCERSFFRHATSKITSEEDLFRVRTLGFRGEALASIAAVSRLTIKTSTGNEAGTKLFLEGGKIISKDKSDARQGTDILVEGLFYNTPARLKYMKTIHTELGHITDVLNRMALSHPTIRFECFHNEKRLFQTSGKGDLHQVIAQVYGIATAKKMIPIQTNTLDFEIEGLIAKPEVTRSSRNYISTIINGRYIKNPIINKAILEGYHTLLPIGRNPLVVLNIEMDPILVDVNVHPAKLEVRFSKEKELFEAVKTAIQAAFKQQRLIPEYQKERVKREVEVQSAFSFTAEKEEPKQATIENAREFSPVNLNNSWDTNPTIHENNPFEKRDSIRDYPEKTEEMQAYEAPITNESQLEEENSIQPNENRVPIMYPIGQLHGTYILAQNEQGLYIIDQHAAQERIKYEYFRDKLGMVSNEVQELLMPMTFDFSKQEALMIEEYRDELTKVGLFMEPFGGQSYIVRSHPQWFPTGFEEEIIQEIIEQILQEQKVNLVKLREEAAILMSCKGSIKANHYLNDKDMFTLLEDLRKSSDPFTCPHGRPIINFFSGYELEKMFKRVM